MTTTPGAAPRGMFREPEGALPNTLMLIWTSVGWLASFPLMAAAHPGLNVLGMVLCLHTMVLAAYAIHEAAHYTLFARPDVNLRVGEWMSFIAGASYASFERIRHLHIRHHRDRADVTCFDFKGLMGRQPWLRRTLQVLEWCYIPATEALMHLQVVWRPFFVRSQRRYLPRAAGMLLVRGALLAGLGWWSLKALLLYLLAYWALLHVLNFFDAFHHTFDQFFVQEDEPVPMNDRDRRYEQANTFSNLISARWPVLNLLTLNFGYHNAHHERAAVPWYKLPQLHAELYGDRSLCVMPLAELLRTFHRNRVRRVVSLHYGAPEAGSRRADSFVGAHGVSFLTVM
jgi:fatty acid desaturase